MEPWPVQATVQGGWGLLPPRPGVVIPSFPPRPSPRERVLLGRLLGLLTLRPCLCSPWQDQTQGLHRPHPHPDPGQHRPQGQERARVTPMLTPSGRRPRPLPAVEVWGDQAETKALKD